MKIFWDYFDIKPKVKQRPRMTRRGFAYTPAATKLYESQVAGAYRGNPNAEFFENEQLSVKIILDKSGFELNIEELDSWEPTKQRGDIDNLAKSILDALNGVAYTDDAQIRILYIEKRSQ